MYFHAVEHLPGRFDLCFGDVDAICDLKPAELLETRQAPQTGEKSLAADDAISTTAYPIIEKKFERVILRTLFDEFA